MTEKPNGNRKFETVAKGEEAGEDEEEGERREEEVQEELNRGRN